MKCIVELSEVEEITLQQLSINHRHRDTRTRAAGLLLLDRKVMPKVIAEQLGVSDQSVYNWLHVGAMGYALSWAAIAAADLALFLRR
jgi:hypothetical protein